MVGVIGLTSRSPELDMISSASSSRSGGTRVRFWLGCCVQTGCPSCVQTRSLSWCTWRCAVWLVRVQGSEHSMHGHHITSNHNSRARCAVPYYSGANSELQTSDVQIQCSGQCCVQGQGPCPPCSYTVRKLRFIITLSARELKVARSHTHRRYRAGRRSARDGGVDIFESGEIMRCLRGTHLVRKLTVGTE